MRMMTKRIAQAMTNLMPAKVSGGRSSRPSLMNSQVEPQMPQSISQTRRAFMLTTLQLTKKHKQHDELNP